MTSYLRFDVINAATSFKVRGNIVIDIHHMTRPRNNSEMLAFIFFVEIQMVESIFCSVKWGSQVEQTIQHYHFQS